MKKILRRIRGLMGVGISWGALWSAIGAGIGTAIGMLRPEVWGWSNPILEWAIGIGLYGFASGVGFGAILSLRDGRKTLLELSTKRMAIWGVIGAGVAPLVFGAMGMFPAGTTALDIIGAMLVTGSLGGVFAPASVAIARRAELQDGAQKASIGSGSGGSAIGPGPDKAGQ